MNNSRCCCCDVPLMPIVHVGAQYISTSASTAVEPPAVRISFGTVSYVDYCKECEAYLRVVLPMVKLVREKSLRGELV